MTDKVKLIIENEALKELVEKFIKQIEKIRMLQKKCEKEENTLDNMLEDYNKI